MDATLGGFDGSESSSSRGYATSWPTKTGSPGQGQGHEDAAEQSLEVGIRVLMLLAEAFPAGLDLNDLVLLDHGLLHSADLGGPESLHPPLPIRAGEFGMKRRTIEQGLEVMIRAGLAEMAVGQTGIRFAASERAYGFVNLLASEYAATLHSRATWVIGHFGDLSETSLRSEMRSIFDQWSEEFEPIDSTGADGR